MNPSYVRIRRPLAEASSRFADWISLPELQPAQSVPASKAVSAACVDGGWRGVAVFIHERDDWTVIEDLTGHLASYSSQRWVNFAGDHELVYAGYNDAVPYAQLLFVRGGLVVREFLDDRQDSAHNVNRGRLDFEAASPINNWPDAASFVDGDTLADLGVPDGVLRIFGPAT